VIEGISAKKKQQKIQVTITHKIDLFSRVTTCFHCMFLRYKFSQKKAKILI